MIVLCKFISEDINNWVCLLVVQYFSLFSYDFSDCHTQSAAVCCGQHAVTLDRLDRLDGAWLNSRARWGNCLNGQGADWGNFRKRGRSTMIEIVDCPEFGRWLSDCRTVGLSDAVGLSDVWKTVWDHPHTANHCRNGCRTLSDCRTVGLSDCRMNVGYCRNILSDCRTGAQLARR